MAEPWDCRLGPAPDDVCWVLNLVYERSDSQWRGWLEPLPGPLVGDGAPKLFEQVDSDVDSVRLQLASAIGKYLSELDSLSADEFYRRHAIRLLRRELPDTQWPPLSDRYRKLDFPAPVTNAN